MISPISHCPSKEYVGTAKHPFKISINIYRILLLLTSDIRDENMSFYYKSINDIFFVSA